MGGLAFMPRPKIPPRHLLCWNSRPNRARSTSSNVRARKDRLEAFERETGECRKQSGSQERDQQYIRESCCDVRASKLTRVPIRPKRRPYLFPPGAYHVDCSLPYRAAIDRPIDPKGHDRLLSIKRFKYLRGRSRFFMVLLACDASLLHRQIGGSTGRS